MATEVTTDKKTKKAAGTKSEVSETFKETIKAWLDKRAAEDMSFNDLYKKEGKSVEDCCKFIIDCAREGGREGYSDEEVFGWASHYYEEDNINPKGDSGCKVVVNRAIELSDEEKAQLEKEAKEQYKREIMEKYRKKDERIKAVISGKADEGKQKGTEQKAEESVQMTLF